MVMALATATVAWGAHEVKQTPHAHVYKVPEEGRDVWGKWVVIVEPETQIIGFDRIDIEVVKLLSIALPKEEAKEIIDFIEKEDSDDSAHTAVPDSTREQR